MPSCLRLQVTALKVLAWCPRDNRSTLPEPEADDPRHNAVADADADATDADAEAALTGVAAGSHSAAGTLLPRLVARPDIDPRELVPVSRLLHPGHRLFRAVFSGKLPQVMTLYEDASYWQRALPRYTKWLTISRRCRSPAVLPTGSVSSLPC